MPRFAFIAAFILISTFAFAADDEDGPILYDRPRQLGRMSNPDIKESSGLAISLENENLFWTHNDNGDKPRLFAFNGDGTHIAEFAIEGAKHVDWEDLCTFKTERETFMLIGDVGDNEAKRKKSKLYLLREPKLKKNPKFGKVETITPQAEIEFTYEDGAYNCEAVGVDASAGKTAKVIFVTKSDGGTCKVFEMPLPLRKEKGPFVAKAIATLTIPAVTAMSISPDGKRAIVLTYGDAYEFTRGATETWAQAFAKKARVLEMPIRKQGETICYGTDGKTLYLTSEGSPAPLWMIAPRKTE